MAQAWKSQPQKQVIVTHLGTPYTLDGLSVVVRRHENGFDTGTVILEDTQAKNYVDKVSADDTIELKQKDASDASWATILNGVIRRVDPLRSMSGNLLQLECDGAGYGLNMTACGEEYGSESTHASLDTIREMIKDATYGIIPKWVNKLLGTATASGYSYTTYIEDIAGSMSYLYFPYKPCGKSINDICDVLQAIKGTNAGPHWIVDTSSRFLLTTVGVHSAVGDNPAQYWPTWWRTDQDASTLEEGKDFPNFRFEQLAKEANYILYHGVLSKPGNGDFITENQKTLWSKPAGVTLTDDNADYKVGAYSLRFETNTPADATLWYPSSANANWDVTKWGGEHNIPTVNFWAKRDSNTNDNFRIELHAPAGDYRTTISMTADTWTFVNLPMGPYSDRYKGDFVWTVNGAPVWTEIDYVAFLVTPNADPGKGWIDGFHFGGYILRGARPVAAYSATNPLKFKLITDNVAKDDSGVASDDTGIMGRLTYAELLRQQTTPIVGMFTTPIANDILPGQKIHIHAKKKSDGTFRIDKDFRVTRPVHNIFEQDSLTHWEVTDDVTNARPRPAPTQLNILLGAIRPEFQDRQASSIKTREIDITQAILEKTY